MTSTNSTQIHAAIQVATRLGIARPTLARKFVQLLRSSHRPLLWALALALALAILPAHSEEPWARSPELKLQASGSMPPYPEEALLTGIEGRVALAYSIDKSGRPANISVLTSDDPTLENAAIQTLSAVKYKVPRDWGASGNTWTRFNILINFVLDKNEPRPEWIPHSTKLVVRAARPRR